MYNNMHMNKAHSFSEGATLCMPCTVHKHICILHAYNVCYTYVHVCEHTCIQGNVSLYQ